jgi:dihydrofolate reductase
MGKLVVTEFVSLDGVIEEPQWTFEFDRGEEGDSFKGEELRKADAQLLGRVTYQGFARAWPSMADDWFGEKMNAMPKYVVSTTLTDDDADWTNSTVIRDDVAAQISRVKREVPGEVLVAVSARLVRTLAEHDLVDEYRLMVFPVVLGAGKRLFDEGTPRTVLRLVDSKPVGPDGVFVVTYQPAGRSGDVASLGESRAA